MDRITLQRDIDKPPYIYLTSRRQVDWFPNSYDIDSLFHLNEFFDEATGERVLLTPEQLEPLRAIFQGVIWLIIDVAECEIELGSLYWINERMEEILGRPYTKDDDYDNLCLRNLNVVLFNYSPNFPRVNELHLAERPLSGNPYICLGIILYECFTTIELCDDDVDNTSDVWDDNYRVA